MKQSVIYMHQQIYGIILAQIFKIIEIEKLFPIINKKVWRCWVEKQDDTGSKKTK